MLVHYRLEIRIKERKKNGPFNTESLKSTALDEGSTCFFLLRSDTKYFRICALHVFVVTSNSAVEGLRLPESPFLAVVARIPASFTNGRIFFLSPGFVRVPARTRTGTSPSLQNRLYDFFLCLPANKYLHKRQDTV